MREFQIGKFLLLRFKVGGLCAAHAHFRSQTLKNFASIKNVSSVNRHQKVPDYLVSAL